MKQFLLCALIGALFASSAASLAAGVALADSDLVATPAGYVFRSLVHQVAAGTHVLGHGQESNEMSIARLGLPLLGATHSGWIADAGWSLPDGSSIVSFTSTWQVPPEPVEKGDQIIYFFNGMENSARDTILQPVLQWGTAPNGGGQYWAVASWFVGAEGTYYTNPVQVKPGDTLVGVMTRTQSAQGFSYNSVFQGIPGTSLNIDNVSELVWLNETLEAYGANTCRSYPTGVTQFKSIGIQTSQGTPTVDWSTEDRETGCGQRATVVSNSATGGEVDIYTN